MMTISWCKEKGLELIEPNDNLAYDYIESAKETMRVTNLIKDSGSFMWIATQKYYAEYLASYAILMKFGIKTDIHSCVIDVISLFEDEGIINFDLSSVLYSDKKLRIENQYYLRNIPVNYDFSELSDLILRIPSLLRKISIDDIERFRFYISSL
ncbi:MAG: hypothetical protein ACOCP4_02115 [Candidatus Woesearchaeota archaeon]